MTLTEEWSEDGYEYCYLEADLDPNKDFSVVDGFTVVDHEWSYNCSLIGEFIKYSPPDEKYEFGWVEIQGQVYELYTWDIMEPIYNEWWDKYCEENYEYCYGGEIYYTEEMMEGWAYGPLDDPYYDYEYKYDYVDYSWQNSEPWAYYDSFYYSYDDPARSSSEQASIMEQLTGWFESSNKLLTTTASLLTLIAFEY